MTNAFDFKNLADFLGFYRDEETCRRVLAEIRFRDGAYCPHCAHHEIYKFKNDYRYRCAGCKRDFTIKTKTLFGDSRLPVRKWFIAIYLLSTAVKGMSSIQLAKHVGVTQKTAWFMDHRIRKAMKQNHGKLFGDVEVDETYIGGLERFKHRKNRRNMGRGTSGKIPVFGLRQRGGKIKLTVISEANHIVLHSEIRRNVEPNSTIHTDEWRGYNNLRGYRREFVKHGSGEYVRGNTTTNGIESIWAVIKRGYRGIYHFWSPKHLHRYLEEFSFRLNNRALKMGELFSEVLKNISDNSKLSFKELTA